MNLRQLCLLDDSGNKQTRVRRRVLPFLRQPPGRGAGAEVPLLLGETHPSFLLGAPSTVPSAVQPPACLPGDQSRVVRGGGAEGTVSVRDSKAPCLLHAI